MTTAANIKLKWVRERAPGQTRRASMAVIPALALAGCCLLPWLPVYKSSGIGISLGEGEDE